MTTKRQIIFLRGGDIFNSTEDYYEFLKNRPYNPYDKHKSWRDWVEWAFSDNFDMLTPTMPCKQNGDYVAWKIWFEKLFPYLSDEAPIIIAQSAGGAFILKYLSENVFPRHVSQLHIVSPMTSSKGLKGEAIGNFAFSFDKLGDLEKQADVVHLYHSEDDPLVPFSHSVEILPYLPKAIFHKFTDRGHFNQPAFPELLQIINDELAKYSI
ncbi:MAG: hypothetical protein WC640_03855 [Candidatus Paceibacterota bacterium]|jgi:hypothetical protein